MTSSDIDWADIRKKLPYERTEDQRKKRMDMFNQFDPNANGFLSLAEVKNNNTCFKVQTHIFLYFNLVTIVLTTNELFSLHILYI
jgi:hypothetical protein